MSGTTYIPHVQDSDAMTDIHARMTGLIERMIPMNRNDSSWLCDGVIPFQDEAYECGRARGALEFNAELLEALKSTAHLLMASALVITHDESRAHALETARAAKAVIFKATGSAA